MIEENETAESPEKIIDELFRNHIGIPTDESVILLLRKMRKAPTITKIVLSLLRMTSPTKPDLSVSFFKKWTTSHRIHDYLLFLEGLGFIMVENKHTRKEATSVIVTELFEENRTFLIGEMKKYTGKGGG